MRFTKYAAVIAAAGAMVLAGCSGGTTAPEETDAPVAEDVSFEAGTTMAKLHDAGKITVGTKFDQPLFGLKGLDGNPEGFDVEIAKIIAGELGIDEGSISWKEAVSANREPFIENGEVDLVVATYTINDKRKEVIDFAGPYYIAGQSFLVPKGNPNNITDPENLGDNVICTVTGSTSEKNIR